MVILVTGGAGYIGSHTCVALLDAGHNIVVIDNLCNSTSKVLKHITKITGHQVPFFKGDVRSKTFLRKIFQNHAIDAVMHFAGLKSVAESCTNPFEYYDNNTTGTLSLCQVMAEYKVKVLIFSSSATVYGSSNQAPFKEAMLTAATNPYGVSKQITEITLHSLVQADPTWRIGILRYFNPVGAHMSGLIGEAPKGIPNNLMPYITQVGMGLLPYLKVFGADYKTVDGTGVRDYIHVCDLACGHLKAIDFFTEGKQQGCHTWNLGLGSGYSVLEMIHAFENASSKKIPYQIKARRSGDCAISYADSSKAHQELNWQAHYTIDDMMQDTWRWQNNYPQGYI